MTNMANVKISNLTSSWTDPTKDYTGLGLSINATSFDPSSKVFRLKVNGNTVFSVDASGTVSAPTIAIANAVVDISSPFNKANAAFLVANASFTLANTVSLQIPVVYNIANVAFDKANASNVLAFNTGIGANNYAGAMANAANAYAASLTPDLSPAFNKANGAYTIANAAFERANSSNDVLYVAAAFDKANAANVLAFNTGIGANNYAGAMANSANAYAITVGASANAFAVANVTTANTAAYANIRASTIAANNYAGIMANSGNAYANTVGTAGNAYATAVGTAGNVYAAIVGTSANAYAATVGTSANAFAVANVTTANTAAYANIRASTIAANAYATSIGTSANAYAIVVGTSANNYAGIMANSGNAYANTVGAAGNAYAITVGTSANNYAGAMANSANAYAIVIGTSANNYAGAMANSANAYAIVIGTSANAYAATVGTSANAFAVANVTTANTAAYANIRASTIAANNYAGAMANSVNAYAASLAQSGDLTPANNWANTVVVYANNYAGAMANSANAYAAIVGTSANNYAGFMANSGNAWVTATFATISTVATNATSANNYAGAMANSANAFAVANVTTANTAAYANIRASTIAANNYAGAMANSANARADTKVSSVSGTSGRITSSGGTTPAIDLASGVVTPTAATGGISALTVDTYGRVTAITGSAGYVTSATAGSLSVTATGSTTARTLETRFADIINVKDFGAVGDNNTNDTNAFTQAFNAVANTGGELYIPPGRYRLNQRISITTAKSVSIRGSARGASELIWASGSTNGGGISITYTNANQTNTSPEVRNLSLYTEANGVGIALLITAPSPVQNTPHHQGPVVDNLVIHGNDLGTQCWNTGIEFKDCWYTKIDFVFIRGKWENGPTLTSLNGFKFTNCMGVYAKNFTIFHVTNGVLDAVASTSALVGGEGFMFSDFEMVGVTNGFNLQAPVTRPGTNIGPGHINAYLFGIHCYLKNDLTIHDLLIYKTPSVSSNYVGIQLYDCRSCHIHNCMISGESTGTGGSIYGILVSGYPSAPFPGFAGIPGWSDNLNIHDNTFGDFYGTAKVGIYLGYGVGNAHIHNNFGDSTISTAVQFGSDAEKTNKCFNNHPLSVQTLTSNSGNPSVGNALNERWNTSNSVATTITGFQDGYLGQVVTLLVNDTNTSFQHNAGLILRGGTNFTATNGTLIQFVRDPTLWREFSRSAY
jgi:hypothetical protein